MSVPSWSEIKQTRAYRDGHREVADMIASITGPMQLQLEALKNMHQHDIDAAFKRIQGLEAEVAALKLQETRRKLAAVKTVRGKKVRTPNP